MYADSLKRKDDFTGDVRIMISIFVAHQWLTLGGGERWPPIYWKTIVFCSKKMEICDVILPKQ